MNEKITIPAGYIHHSEVRGRGWSRAMIKNHLREYALSDGTSEGDKSPYWYPKNVVAQLEAPVLERKRAAEAEAEAEKREAEALLIPRDPSYTREGAWSRTLLKENGWTDTLIKRHLGEPDFVTITKNDRALHLWARDRVLNGPDLIPELKEGLEKSWERQAKRAQREIRKIIDASGRTPVPGGDLTISIRGMDRALHVGDVLCDTIEHRCWGAFLVLTEPRWGRFVDCDDTPNGSGHSFEVVEVVPTPEERALHEKQEMEKKLAEEARWHGDSEARRWAGWDSSIDLFPHIPPDVYMSYRLGYRIDGAGGHDRVMKLLDPLGNTRFLLDVTPEQIREAWEREDVREYLIRWAQLIEYRTDGTYTGVWGTSREVAQTLHELRAG